MTEPDLSQPVQPGGDSRGVGESLDAPAADVPTVDEQDAADGPAGTAPGPRVEVVDEIVEVVEIVPQAPQPVTLRRAPRYRAFIGTGAAIGVILGVVLTGAFPDDGHFSTAAVTGYLAVSLALVGALAGAGAAVLLERRGAGPR